MTLGSRRDGWRSHGASQPRFDLEFHGEPHTGHLTWLHDGGSN